MSLHRLDHVIIGVPNVEETAAYYDDFGLSRAAGNNPATGGVKFATTHGGDQLGIVAAETRRMIELGIAADSPDDLDRVTRSLEAAGFGAERQSPERLFATDPVTGVRAQVVVRERLETSPICEPATYNGPYATTRRGRAPGILREGAVRPRRLGHAVTGTPDLDVTMRFFVDGLGFKVSDHIGGHGAFLRCSEDHHNLLVMAAPLAYLHHTSWQVDDVDDVGRGAFAMLEKDPERHVWGLGRHHAGSNFFWYLKDPAGNFSEYFSDMDVIPEEEIWTPEVLEGAKGLFSWGPPPPPSFLEPDDLAGLMTGAHAPR